MNIFVFKNSIHEANNNSAQPGDCICKTGFSGPRCDQCAKGYHNYPNCSPCPCNLAGTLNGACDGDCVCKANVEGQRCDKCKSGFFALHESNPLGMLYRFITRKQFILNLILKTYLHFSLICRVP